MLIVLIVIRRIKIIQNNSDGSGSSCGKDVDDDSNHDSGNPTDNSYCVIVDFYNWFILGTDTTHAHMEKEDPANTR